MEPKEEVRTIQLKNPYYPFQVRRHLLLQGYVFQRVRIVIAAALVSVLANSSDGQRWCGRALGMS